MPRLTKPNAAQIAAFVESQRDLQLTYEGVGCTASHPPPGYVVDHHRTRIGQGDDAYAAAVEAIRRWDHFRFGWIEPHPDGVPIRAGETVAVLARVLGCWWLNPCRIVDTIDEDDRFGFAYGTLPGHAESGEERFLVERDAEGVVWYDILAFSRPRSLLARLGYPLTRRIQKQFARDSAEAMRLATFLAEQQT